MTDKSIYRQIFEILVQRLLVNDLFHDFTLKLDYDYDFKTEDARVFRELFNDQLLLFSRSADRAKVAFHPEFLRKIPSLSAIMTVVWTQSFDDQGPFMSKI